MSMSNLNKMSINIDSEHLATGSKFPELKDGVVRIYSMRFCPYAQRAVLVAAAKNIPFEVINCNLRQKAEWLFEKNPGGKVPTLEFLDNGKSKVLYESLIVSDYLDEAFSSATNLNPGDPYAKALDRIWMEIFNKPIGLYYKAVFNTTDDGTLEESLKSLMKDLVLFDEELKKRSSKFFSGDTSPGMLDYMIWPWFERFPILELIYPQLFHWESELKNKLSTLAQWIERMKEDPAVKLTYLNPEIQYKYAMSSKKGSPNYELLSQL